MDFWPVLAVVLVGALLGLAAWIWPWLDPNSPLRVAQELGAVLNAWSAVRDAVGWVRLERPGEEGIEARVLYLAPSSVRVEVQTPAELAGHVFAFRPLPEGQLLLHYRPDLEIATETRFAHGQELIPLPDWNLLGEELRRGQVRLARLDSTTFSIQGFPTLETEVVLEVNPQTNLPVRVQVAEKGEQSLQVWFVDLVPNRGLELRDLFTLDPLPRRWFFLRVPKSGA